MDKSLVDFDTIIVGAGISGINAAYRLQTQCPNQTFTILEGRDTLGGTWSFFRYPGIRSDSDLFTFGFPWRPWKADKAIARGGLILEYMNESAKAYGIDQKIRYRHKVLSADWSSETRVWTLTVDVDGTEKKLRSQFVLFGTGYYDYETPLAANIPGLHNFQGQVIHPQFWPKDLDYTDKSIVIIGSGATAITLLPELAQKAAHVTMLQRSPSWIVSVPSKDASVRFLGRWLPSSWAARVLRWKYLLISFLFFQFCRRFPGAARRQLVKGSASQLPPTIALDPHFQPTYNPWDQRVCFCPDGDFYRALSKGNAEVVTGQIENITEKGIVLKNSDKTLYPDIIVTATGLKLQVVGGAKITVDKEPVKLDEKHVWRGAMIQDVPNSTTVLGYSNSSWTPGADATAQLFTRLVNYMGHKGLKSFVPKISTDVGMNDRPVFGLKSTYVIEAEARLPKAGDKSPWLPRSNYFKDIWAAKYGNITKGLKFT